MALLQIASKPARGIPKRPKVRLGDLPKGSVRQPGEKGYFGSMGDNPEHRQQWGHRAADMNRRAAFREEISDESFNRRWGKIHTGVAAGMAASGVGGGMAVNAFANREARKIKSGARDRQLGVRKAWSGSSPFFRAAERTRRGHHVVTGVKAKPGITERYLQWAGTNQGGKRVMLAGGAIASGGFATGAALGDEKVDSAQRRRRAVLRRQQQARVAKSNGGAAYLRNLRAQAGPHFGSPKKAAATLRRNPQLLAFGGVGAAAGATGPVTRERSQRTRERRDAAARTAYGAIAGQAAYQGATYGSHARANAKHNAIYLDPVKRRGYHDVKDKKVMESHKAKYGLNNPKVPSDFKGFHRNFPTSVPGGRHIRLNAHLTTGRRGFAVGTAATVGGALLARGGHGRKESVGKALYQREETLSPSRALGLGVGSVLAAYGIGHSKMVGRGIARGVKMAQRGEYHGVADALQRAQAARGSIRVGMAPGEAAVRRIHALNEAIELVPRAIRPEVALVAGTMLAARSMPVHRTNYRPVSHPAY